MTVKNVYDHYLKSLSSLYEKGETESITQWMLEDRLGISKSQILLGGDDTISEVKANDLAWKLMRLMKGEPIQYILGYTSFYGLKLKVNKSVLIPRPETEELVEWIISENKNKTPLKILDIGTGSGCIAIALKKNLPHAEIIAIDISADALKVANENADQNQTEILFIQSDILSSDFQLSATDTQLPPSDPEASGRNPINIIVSNPPYITDKEKSSLHKNVLDHEPPLALFVPEHDPLLFYKVIIMVTGQDLSHDGILYFEVNPDYASEVSQLLHDAGLLSTQIKKDMNGHERMVRAMR